jgi:small-conductance mechanosensitive channel
MSERSGINQIISRSGIKSSLSTLIAKFAGWVIIFAFAIIALDNLRLPAIERLFESFFLYLPNVFIAIIIIIFGLLLGNFFGRAALIASVNAGLKMSGLVGKVVKFSIFVFALSIALEQLGIGKETVVIAFAIVFGGIIFALALAFGLGGRDIAREFLEKKLRGEEEKKDEISHL